MIKQRKIELLAPAKNLECGIEAINHGADAVYIGAPKFGARAAAVNSLEDIEALVQHAHLYNARIYVTVNTILKEEELKETEEMIHALYRIGVDALIVQDMGITKLNLPPIPLHASTQMDNRTPEKVKFLWEAGFRQVVLARELSLREIKKIHESCPEVPLEVFVHGALCVSYSGQCYVSQACFGRSANRGECAQFCRLPFSLVDADGKVIVKDKNNGILSSSISGMKVNIGGIAEKLNLYTAEPVNQTKTVTFPLVLSTDGTQMSNATVMLFPSATSPLFQLIITLKNGTVKTFKQTLSAPLKANTRLTLTLTLGDIFSEEETGNFTIDNWQEESETIEVPSLN